MDITLTRYELQKISKILNSYLNYKDKYFSFHVKRNIDLFKAEIQFINDLLDKLAVIVKSYAEYEKKRHDICEKYCDRNEDGSPLIINNNYTFKPEHATLVMKKIDDLYKSNKSVIEQFKKEVLEIDKIMSESITISISPIPFERIPNDVSYVDFEALIKENLEQIEQIL